MYGLEVKDNPAKKTKKSDWEAKCVIQIRAHGPKKIRKFFCDKEVVLFMHFYYAKQIINT